MLHDGSYLIVESELQQKPDIKRLNARKAVFRMVIQVVDTVNRNNRLYPSNVVMKALKAREPKMRERGFYGELDHPIETGQDQFDNIRQTTVCLKEVSHIITGYEKSGNNIIAEIETTDTENGHILLGLLRDNNSIGMSLRGFAQLIRRNNYYEVQDPLTIISYDAVSDPSFTSAVIDFNDVVFENKQYLTESMIYEKDNNVVCVSGRCFLSDYFDKLVESKVFEIAKKWI